MGDRFYLCENKILCEYDYEERLVFANMAYNPSSLAHIRRQVNSLQVCIKFCAYILYYLVYIILTVVRIDMSDIYFFDGQIVVRIPILWRCLKEQEECFQNMSKIIVC